MLKKLGFSALILGASLALAQPRMASAADRDDFRHEYREAPRLEHARIERERNWRRYDGYYDRDGCWHSRYDSYRR